MNCDCNFPQRNIDFYEQKKPKFHLAMISMNNNKIGLLLETYFESTKKNKKKTKEKSSMKSGFVVMWSLRIYITAKW